MAELLFLELEILLLIVPLLVSDVVPLESLLPFEGKFFLEFDFHFINLNSSSLFFTLTMSFIILANLLQNYY